MYIIFKSIFKTDPYRNHCSHIFLVYRAFLKLLLLSLQSYLTLCNPIDGSPPGSAVPGILQARITGVGCHFLLQCMKMISENEISQSCLTLSDPMTVAHQAPPSMGFSRQEYWIGLYQLNFRYIF